MENVSPVSKVEHRLIDWELLAKKWLHSRKLALYLVVFVLVTVAFFIHKIDGGQWIDGVKWATTGYMSANALDGIGDALKK